MWAVNVFGGIGRLGLGSLASGRMALVHVSRVSHLLVLATYFASLAPMLGKSKLRAQLSPMLSNVGVRSFPIVALVNLLTGAILVLQTGDVMQNYGQIQEVPGLVALSVVRELGPLMTAVVMTSRIGASFTAVLAAMKLNDEIQALETMAIHPVGYLVAPRMLSIVIMMPCLTMLAYLIGMGGGAVVAYSAYDISFTAYVDKTIQYLDLADLAGGLIKAVVFGLLIGVISCYYGMQARGGPTGLGRYLMVSIVTSLVVVVFADAVLTAFVVNYLF